MPCSSPSRLGGAVLAAEVPDLAGLLLTHDSGQVPRAVTGVEGAAFSEARDDASVGVILLTGVNHGGAHEDEAFCSGGDQKIRGKFACKAEARGISHCL